MFTRSASFAMEWTCRTVVCILGQRISRLHACTISGVEKVAKTAVVWSTGSFTCRQCVPNLFPVLCWLSKMAAVIFYDDCTTLWKKPINNHWTILKTFSSWGCFLWPYTCLWWFWNPLRHSKLW